MLAQLHAVASTFALKLSVWTMQKKRCPDGNDDDKVWRIIFEWCYLAHDTPIQKAHARACASLHDTLLQTNPDSYCFQWYKALLFICKAKVRPLINMFCSETCSTHAVGFVIHLRGSSFHVFPDL